MTKDTFLKIQADLWDFSPSYPGELTKEAWLEICGKFYDEYEDLLKDL